MQQRSLLLSLAVLFVLAGVVAARATRLEPPRLRLLFLPFQGDNSPAFDLMGVAAQLQAR
jgi:hypothetical protein